VDRDLFSLLGETRGRSAEGVLGDITGITGSPIKKPGR